MESAIKTNVQSSPVQPGRPLPHYVIALRFWRSAMFRLTHWETWDWRIKYIFITPAWLWFCLKARSPWFFTAANPSLTFGGFHGENKSEMYAQLPPSSYPKTAYALSGAPFAEIENIVKCNHFEFPLVVKPQVGKMGLMFRKINSFSELRSYHAVMPADYIIQEWIGYPLELSVFYYRIPGQQKGTITGFVRKDFLEVIGDGHSTLWQLILEHPRAQFRTAEMKAKHKARLADVLANGERFCLSPALNLSRGGKLISLEHEKDARLLSFFDNLSQYTQNFYYGRYDLKCRSVEDLKAGNNFSILEYNGSGAEPHHVYGNGYSLFQACCILVAHWRILYKISVINRKKGIDYWNLKRGWQFLRFADDHFKMLRQLDRQTAL